MAGGNRCGAEDLSSVCAGVEERREDRPADEGIVVDVSEGMDCFANESDSDGCVGEMSISCFATVSCAALSPLVILSVAGPAPLPTFIESSSCMLSPSNSSTTGVNSGM